MYHFTINFSRCNSRRRCRRRFLSVRINGVHINGGIIVRPVDNRGSLHILQVLRRDGSRRRVLRIRCDQHRGRHGGAQFRAVLHNVLVTCNRIGACPTVQVRQLLPMRPPDKTQPCSSPCSLPETRPYPPAPPVLRATLRLRDGPWQFRR